MLWASDALGRDGKPAVLLLSVTRTRAALVAELAYVAADLPEGPLPGRYYRAEGAAPESVSVHWPDGWPEAESTNHLHPRRDTPGAALSVVAGENRVRLSISEEEPSVGSGKDIPPHG